MDVNRIKARCYVEACENKIADALEVRFNQQRKGTIVIACEKHASQLRELALPQEESQ